MTISISHCCGHAADHVVYGSHEQVTRQRESISLVDVIDQIPLMDHDAFHDFEVRLVSLYRHDERAQEEIAVALTTINMRVDDPSTRLRINEILDMLQHVHDPLISASSASPPPADQHSLSAA